MDKTLPTRYFAAYNNDNASNIGKSKCADFLDGIVTDIDRRATFCDKYNLNDVNNLGNISTLVMAPYDESL